LKWNEAGKIINCCEHHLAIDFGECDNLHCGTFNNCDSLSFVGINKKYECLSLIMFHNHVYRDKSLSNHLNNNQIFTSFPLHTAEFLNGHLITQYCKHAHEIYTCFNDIEFMFPREVGELYIQNYNCKRSFFEVLPVSENWYHCLKVVGELQEKHLQTATRRISRIQKRLQNEKKKRKQDHKVTKILYDILCDNCVTYCVLFV
jgi:hypothetical protein